MAKSNALKIKSNKSTKADDVEEIDSPEAVEVMETDEGDDTPEAVETQTNEDEKDRNLRNLVPFSAYEELRPAPTVGNISLVKDMGMPFLPKGVSRIPYIVAVVLEDKKLGQIIKL